MSLSSKAFPPEYIENSTYKEAARNTGEGKKKFLLLFIYNSNKKSLINQNGLAQYINRFI